MTHLLLSTETPYPFPKFDTLTPADFEKAITHYSEIAAKQIETLRMQEEAPSFANTFAPLDSLLLGLFQIKYIAGTYSLATGKKEMIAVESLVDSSIYEIEAKLYQDDVILSRMDSIYAARDSLNLNKEDRHFMEVQYRKFQEKGGFISPEKKALLKDVDLKLKTLSENYSSNLKDSQIECSLYIEDVSVLDGLSQDTIDSFHANAKKHNRGDGWLVIPDRTMVSTNYLVYASNPEFRKNIWDAAQSVGAIESFDNTDIVQEMIRLREERAQLLGFSNYAEIALQKTMAKTPEAVRNFLTSAAQKVLPAYAAEVAKFQALAAEHGFTQKLKSWDIPYWARKYQESKFQDIDTNLDPYFEINNVIEGFFSHLEKLLKIKFEQSNAYPAYHPDVRIYEGRDIKTGKVSGLLCADFYARAGEKRMGAWMESLTLNTEGHAPSSFISMNFQKPQEGQPSLLKLQDGKTFYHEGGHAMHHIIGVDGAYTTLKGITSSADYVEFPSQIMENYFSDPECLRENARHYETGEPLSDKQIEFIVESSRFNKLMSMVSLVVNSMRDLVIHTSPSSLTSDPDKLAELTKFNIEGEEYAPVINFTRLSHLFSEPLSQYAAGYYSYAWSQMLDATGFAVMKEAGIYDAQKALTLKAAFAKGATLDEAETFKEFAGREISLDAVLKRLGIEPDKTESGPSHTMQHQPG